MALAKAFKSGSPLQMRGQGAVEAILSLPVFLILVCVVSQLFFLGIAQMQLQYAAFCAVRVGAVNAADKAKMMQTVKKILSGSPGLTTLPEGSFDVEILDRERSGKRANSPETGTLDETLKVRVHWNYPLIVPFVDRLPKRKNLYPSLERPFIHLNASWAMKRFGSGSAEKNNAQ